MTQQLVVWALLMSLAGLVWLFTCALLTKDRSTTGPAEEPADHNNIQALSDTQEPNTTQRKAAA